MKSINQDLKKLIKGLVEEDYLICDKCNHRATNNRSLNLHIQSKHENIKYKCPDCDKIYSNKGYMLIHKKNKHEKKKIKCEYCVYHFRGNMKKKPSKCKGLW